MLQMLEPSSLVHYNQHFNTAQISLYIQYFEPNDDRHAASQSRSYIKQVSNDKYNPYIRI